jgi:hypothetical protein
VKLAAEIERDVAGFDTQRRRVFEATLNKVAQTLVHARSTELERMADLLFGFGDSTTQEGYEALVAWGGLRSYALFKAIEEASLQEPDLLRAGLSPAEIEKLLAEDRLLAIELPTRSDRVYPRWQFTEDTRPKPYLPQLMAAARDCDLDSTSLHGLMTHPDAGDPPGATLVEACDRGRVDLAINAISTSGQLGG